MKASKILAVLSATALAASMYSSVSAYAIAPEEPEDENTVAVDVNAGEEPGEDDGINEDNEPVVPGVEIGEDTEDAAPTAGQQAANAITTDGKRQQAKPTTFTDHNYAGADYDLDNPYIPINPNDFLDMSLDSSKTNSEDLYDYLKSVHDLDPNASAVFRFNMIGTQEGVPVSTFLKVWEDEKAPDGKTYQKNKDTGECVGTEAEEVDEVAKDSDGNPKVKPATLKFDVTFTKNDKAPEGSSSKDEAYWNIENKESSINVTDTKYHSPNGETFSTVAEAPAWMQKYLKAATSLENETEKKKYWYVYELIGYGEDGNGIYQKTDKRYPADGDKAITVEDLKAWHNYYLTEMGLMDVQTKNDMAKGVTNAIRATKLTDTIVTNAYRYAQLTQAQIANIKATNGMYYDDQKASPTYGSFMVFGDGVTPKEYEFTLSAEAVDQILKVVLKQGETYPDYSEKVWKTGKQESHGPIWIQAPEQCKLSNVTVTSEVVTKVINDANVDGRVAKDELAAFYGVETRKEMYEGKASDSSSSSSTASSSAAAADPAAGGSDATAADGNAETGAAAGLGIAGMVLAGAAIVCAKKRK